MHSRPPLHPAQIRLSGESCTCTMQNMLRACATHTRECCRCITTGYTLMWQAGYRAACGDMAALVEGRRQRAGQGAAPHRQVLRVPVEGAAVPLAMPCHPLALNVNARGRGEIGLACASPCVLNIRSLSAGAAAGGLQRAAGPGPARAARPGLAARLAPLLARLAPAACSAVSAHRTCLIGCATHTAAARVAHSCAALCESPGSQLLHGGGVCVSSLAPMRGCMCAGTGQK